MLAVGRGVLLGGSGVLVLVSVGVIGVLDGAGVGLGVKVGLAEQAPSKRLSAASSARQNAFDDMNQGLLSWKFC